MAVTSDNKTPIDDGKDFVVVKGGDESAGSKSQNSEPVEGLEDEKCPDIVYKVQYKDADGEIKGTKQLSAPYKLKTFSYGDAGTPILEVVYSVTVWFPKVYNKGKGLAAKEDAEKKDGENEEFNERSMDNKELIIHSQAIIKALRSLVDYYPGQSLLGDTISIKEPCSILVHYRKQLDDYRKSCSDPEAYHHIGVLQQYLEDNLGDKIMQEDQRHAKSTPVATFEMLWMLYKPGDDVYATLDDQRGGFVLQSCEPDSENYVWGRPTALKVLLWYLDFDGHWLGRRQHEVIIAPFDGEREITSLKVFPASFLESQPDLSPRTKLEDRGEKFFSLLRGKQMDYKGYSLPTQEVPRRHYEGRVIVDQGSFYTYASWSETNKHPVPTFTIDDDEAGVLSGVHYDCSCSKCAEKRRAVAKTSRWGTYETIDPRETTSLEMVGEDGKISRHRYFLLPRRIMGFDLKSKTWNALDIDCCHEPRIQVEAIENLVLSAEKQELIKALVHKYTASKQSGKKETTWAADPIPNKGEGQIFLLHGPPGAGKTFTAECVAEFTSRPLLSLTCGDIGTDEAQVESSLRDWFSLAEAWGAVMLIDEADVYLERREVNELTRNGLVSVFLRAMEYYRGILFLTTNRVGHFDPAFFSRIHVYIGYRPLEPQGRRQIWLQLFKKLESERADDITVRSGAKNYVLSDDVLRDVDWNGREIRNGFQTAVALAEYEADRKRKALKDTAGRADESEGKIELRQDHFEKVLEMSLSFKRYLASVGPNAKNDEESRAKESGDRGDDALL